MDKFKAENDADLWEIWGEVRARLCGEFKITEIEFDKIIEFCYRRIEDELDLSPLLELPMREFRAAIRRTLPKLPQLEQLTELRKKIGDLDSDFYSEYLVKEEGKWKNQTISDFLLKKDAEND